MCLWNQSYDFMCPYSSIHLFKIWKKNWDECFFLLLLSNYAFGTIFGFLCKYCGKAMQNLFHLWVSCCMNLLLLTDLCIDSSYSNVGWAMSIFFFFRLRVFHSDWCPMTTSYQHLIILLVSCPNQKRESSVFAWLTDSILLQAVRL